VTNGLQKAWEEAVVAQYKVIMTFPGRTGQKRKSEQPVTVVQPDCRVDFRERQTCASNLPHHMQITVIVVSNEDNDLYQRLNSQNL
jgi:3'-phosphoadenosine 5'-phosphosulfate sulfotransferase (PAPS reductase)/FAD synthetase